MTLADQPPPMTLGEAVELLATGGWACACTGPVPGHPAGHLRCNCELVFGEARQLQRGAHIAAKQLAGLAERLELRQFRTAAEQRQRYEIESVVLRDGTDALSLYCPCRWSTDVEYPTTLAELVRRADQHTQDCR